MYYSRRAAVHRQLHMLPTRPMNHPLFFGLPYRYVRSSSSSGRQTHEQRTRPLIGLVVAAVERATTPVSARPASCGGPVSLTRRRRRPPSAAAPAPNTSAAAAGGESTPCPRDQGARAQSAGGRRPRSPRSPGRPPSACSAPTPRHAETGFVAIVLDLEQRIARSCLILCTK